MNTYHTTKTFRSKKGVEIACGEAVTLSFNVKAKGTGAILPNYVRMTTADGRTIITGHFAGTGLRTPSLAKLESYDSVAKSVFGTDVEPDGWSYDGSPSWLLALNLI